MAQKIPRIQDNSNPVTIASRELLQEGKEANLLSVLEWLGKNKHEIERQKITHKLMDLRRMGHTIGKGSAEQQLAERIIKILNEKKQPVNIRAIRELAKNKKINPLGISISAQRLRTMQKNGYKIENNPVGIRSPVSLAVLALAFDGKQINSGTVYDLARKYHRRIKKEWVRVQLSRLRRTGIPIEKNYSRTGRPRKLPR
jgi:hypothetical protein